MTDIKPLGDDVIITADNYGPPMREMCEIRFSPELTEYITETHLFDMAEKFFAKLRKKYIPKIKDNE